MILCNEEALTDPEKKESVDVIAIGEAIHETEDIAVDVVIFSNEIIYIGSNIIEGIQYNKTTGVIGEYKSIDELNAAGWITTITNLAQPAVQITVHKEDVNLVYRFNTYDVYITHELNHENIRCMCVDQGDICIAKIPVEEIRSIEWKNLAPSFIKMHDDRAVPPLYTISISRT